MNIAVTGNWDSSGRVFTPAGAPVNAVRVAARRDQQNGNPMATSIAAALGVTSVDISVSSIAAQSASAAGGACIIALSEIDPYASQAFFIKGNASVKTWGCDIQVNSCNATDALKGPGMARPANGSGTTGGSFCRCRRK